MKLKTRYLLAATFVTAACAWDLAQLPVDALSFVFLVVAMFLIGWSGSAKVRFPWSRPWNAVVFFKWLSGTFALALFGVLAVEIPVDRFEAMRREWHFTGTIWLLLLSVLALEYFEEKKKQEQKAATDGSSSPG